MDFAKLLALFLTSLIASFSVAFNYKTKVRSDDPSKPEKELLSRIGKIALLVIVLAGSFSLYSEVQNQRSRTAEKDNALAQVKRDFEELQKKQEEQNRVSQEVLQQMKDTLDLIRKSQLKK